MCPEDDPDNPINASSATACHCVVLKALNKARYVLYKLLLTTTCDHDSLQETCYSIIINDVFTDKLPEA